MLTPNTYLGLTANNLACIATELEQRNSEIMAENVKLRKFGGTLLSHIHKGGEMTLGEFEELEGQANALGVRYQ